MLNWWEQILRSKNEIPMKIPDFKRFGIGIIVEFHGIPTRFPNQASMEEMTIKQSKGRCGLEQPWIGGAAIFFSGENQQIFVCV